jgi:hypothetical protein
MDDATTDSPADFVPEDLDDDLGFDLDDDLETEACRSLSGTTRQGKCASPQKRRRQPHRKNRKPSLPATHIGKRNNNQLRKMFSK